ncbi:MAG: glycoside hydrolase family 16 protein [Bacteroidetes bacterium]|nr:glycoside hydrolase family 16 protein [Bacteroidota bacterium]MBS1649042.1 glycoside hydrolase family 16 protein [Bacteroidota bacterium]
MKNSVSSILFFTVAFLLNIFGFTQLTSKPLINFNEYHLVFSDEFNYTGMPDSTKWDYEIGLIRNKEPQWYQKENAMVANGVLTITTKKEIKQNTYYNPNSNDWRYNTKIVKYTSASVISKGKFEFKYGRIQARLKINIAKGQWPAFWMLGANRGAVTWPACGEVDIMEYYRGLMHANVAWEGNNGSSSWSAKNFSINKYNNPDYWNVFHVWTMDWDENYIRIYMDDTLLNETQITHIKNAVKGNNPFHEKFYMIINTALGQANETIPDSTLPSQYVIDYIRVYQK